ncbi:hypothetical protein [Euzebya tangerina]|uniref:hypothetical protein n=1 Tax=Euzebya tangerina TaxID=591198 RepID=UPI000E31CB74|nr:hypothetical protein [Euzebya tangerina]
MPDDRPLDAHDPRFGATERAAVPDESRTLVESTGPGISQEDPKVRILRVAVPLLALGAAAVTALIFFTGLSPGSSDVVVGQVDDVRAAVEDRPRRVCFNDANPCAWLTIARGELVAFNTNGPLAEEYGRQGVSWCSTSGWFGANSTGSRWDQDGRIVEGPAPRSLDRFNTSVDADGNLVIDFAALTAGLADWQVGGDTTARSGPPCQEIPFDRDPDLEVPPPAGSAGE